MLAAWWGLAPFPRGAAATSAPTLWVLRTDADPQAEKRLGELVVELGLALENVDVRLAEPPLPDFATRPESEQVRLAIFALDLGNAQAAVWLSSLSSNDRDAPGRGVSETIPGERLHFVAFRDGRTFARTLPVPGEHASLATVALAVRELAGNAYLFADPPRVLPPPTVTAKRTARPARAEGWMWQGYTALRAPLSAGTSAPLAFTLALALRRPVARRLRLGATLEGGVLPRVSLPDGYLAGQTAAAGVFTAYDFLDGSWRVGVRLETVAAWQHISVGVGTLPTQSFDLYTFRVVPGICVQRWFGETWALVAGVSVGSDLPRRGLRRRSDDSVVLEEPAWRWGASLGVVVSN